MKFLNGRNLLVGTVLGGVLLPSMGWACACGCGVFDVGTSAMFPNSTGGMAYVNYDYQDQNHNWSGTSQAPAENNDDKRIQTHFVTTGVQYLFNRSWGASLEIPYANRNFSTAGNTPVNLSGLGDIRIKGLYTGLSEDLSTGITLGLKVPSGSFTDQSDNVDRDTQIGSGSTDLLVGGYYRHNLLSLQNWSWFGQVELDVPLATQDDYRPGTELDTAAGVYYHGWSIGRTTINPVAQAIFSERTSDGGLAANPDNSGYQRLLLSPGLEFHLHPVTIYADVELPVYQNVTGNQLVAPYLLKISVSYHF